MFEYALINGLVVDGSGRKPYHANVYVADGKIAAITEAMLPAKETLDVSGLAITPGFIDTHSHADLAHFKDYPMLSKVAQGVTMELVGNCGTSVMPALGDRLDQINQHLKAKKGRDSFLSVTDYAREGNEKGACMNYGTLIGHSNLRLAVMGFVNRDPSPKEMEEMTALLDREMQRGAFGMSLGLIYPPSAFCKTWELVELAKVIAKYDGILAVHMRNEGPKIFEAVQEMVDIAEQSGVHVQISHLKLAGKPQWGKHPQLLKMITDARARGLNITCDQYPFPASSTGLSALVPHWAHEGGSAQMVERLKAKEGDICEKIAEIIESRGGPQCVFVVTTHGSNPQCDGKFINQLMEELSMNAVEVVLKLLIDGNGAISCIYFTMSEQDMLAIMQQDYICVGSDGSSMSHDPEITRYSPHPRNFAAFTQYFQTVREHKLLPLEQAVYKVTGLPAVILGIRDRGLLQEGMAADIAVFDPEKIASRSTFAESRAWPVGVYHVLVNGQFSIRDGEPTGCNPGKVLLKQL